MSSVKNSKLQIFKKSVKSLRHQYLLCIMVVFIVGFLVDGGYNYYTSAENLKSNIVTNGETARRDVDNILDLIEGAERLTPENAPDALTTYGRSIAAVSINLIANEKAIVLRVINGLDMMLFTGQISKALLIFIMALLYLFMQIFIKNALEIGMKRFFLEHRLYSRTKADRLFFVYHTDAPGRCVITLFLRDLRQFLWMLTIVGGPIKYYEYWMIPYILAENPGISHQEAFRFSKQLMLGYKWTVFTVDMMFLPLYILDTLTFHLFARFFVTPLKECVSAELYIRITGEQANTIQLPQINDPYLRDTHSLARYPDQHSLAHYSRRKHLLEADIERVEEKHYTLSTYILMFFTFSFVGWVWEVFLHLSQSGVFVNRGVLQGPWLPIYGIGCLLTIKGLRPLAIHPRLLLITLFIGSGILEYSASWILEWLFHEKWWDYTGWFLNIDGRTCPEGLLVFTLGGFIVTYFVAPILDNLINIFQLKTKCMICVLLVMLFIADVCYSAFHPNIGEGVTQTTNQTTITYT